LGNVQGSKFKVQEATAESFCELVCFVGCSRIKVQDGMAVHHRKLVCLAAVQGSKFKVQEGTAGWTVAEDFLRAGQGSKIKVQEETVVLHCKLERLAAVQGSKFKDQ
jgi:hypothetical protein